MTVIPYLAVVAALAGLALAFFFFGVVKKASPGSPRMVELMEAIQVGSRAFLRREYKAVAIFILVLAIAIAVALPNGLMSALAYVVGAIFSALAGFIGMTVATMANARTAEAAKSGPQLALPLAFRGGAVMGFTVAGLSLFGVAVAYIIFTNTIDDIGKAIQVVTTY